MQMKDQQAILQELSDGQKLRQCAAEFNLLGDLTRLKICYLLCHHQELSVSQMAQLVGVSVSAVSHTLAKLKQSQIVGSRQEFRHVYYHLKDNPVTDLIRQRLSCV